MNNPGPKVDGYIRKSKEWQAELSELRRIILNSGLTEDVKWRTPCYTFDGANVAFIGRFKDWCVLSFLKGALLKDPQKILALPGENTRSARVIKFTSLDQIKKLESTLKAYLREAIELEKDGTKFDFKKDAEPETPDELKAKFKAMPELKTAFAELTPGRRRWYLIHFAQAKQSKTRTARIEKSVPLILAGKGLNDD